VNYDLAELLAQVTSGSGGVMRWRSEPSMSGAYGGDIVKDAPTHRRRSWRPVPRMTITLSEERHRALREVAARRGISMAELIDESLEAYGIKSRDRARELVELARRRSNMDPAEAERLAVDEVRAYRRERRR
jgi:hypothetical protein